jgi:cytochrome b
MQGSKQVKVWDPVVRLFHWGVVALFAIAYLTEGEGMIHVYSGYGIIALIAVRLVWGFVGPEHARFSSFVRPPRAAVQYLKDELSGNSKRYLGHNPAGGVMVVALLLLLAGTCGAGLVFYAVEEGAGPLAPLLSDAHWLEGIAEEAHELFANLTVLFVLAHIAGVAFSSFMHGENLPRSMVTGMKRGEDDTAEEQL